MAKLKETLYTLVEHSGLPLAVEYRGVRTESQVKRIKEVGGIILDSYEDADSAEYKYNYTGIESSINPNCLKNGVFSKKSHNGSKIFIPADSGR